MKIITLAIIEAEDFKPESCNTPMYKIANSDLIPEIPSNVDAVFRGPFFVNNVSEMVKQLHKAIDSERFIELEKVKIPKKSETVAQEFAEMSKEILKTKESCQKFLVAAGINNSDGSLTENYGGNKKELCSCKRSTGIIQYKKTGKCVCKACKKPIHS